MAASQFGWNHTSFNKFIRFIESIDMTGWVKDTTAGRKIRFVGLKIRLRWVEESISLAE